MFACLSFPMLYFVTMGMQEYCGYEGFRGSFFAYRFQEGMTHAHNLDSSLVPISAPRPSGGTHPERASHPGTCRRPFAHLPFWPFFSFSEPGENGSLAQ